MNDYKPHIGPIETHFRAPRPDSAALLARIAELEQALAKSEKRYAERTEFASRQSVKQADLLQRLAAAERVVEAAEAYVRGEDEAVEEVRSFDPDYVPDVLSSAALRAALTEYRGESNGK